MARIRKFAPESASGVREHPTEVDCGYTIVSLGGQQYLQLNTYGSATRKIPGKVSQTLQLDAKTGKELMTILEKAFP